METKRTDEATSADELMPLHGEFISQRRFLVAVSPLCVVYAASALLYRRSHSLIAMWCNVVALLLLAVVLVWFMFRKPSNSGSRESGTPFHAPRWVALLLRLASNDVWFFGMTVVLPIVLIAVSVLADQLQVGSAWLWCVDSVLDAVYLMYLLVLIFAAGYHAIVVLLTANQRELQHAQREAAIMRRQNELASKTHDTVANGLSDIAMLAEQFCDESDVAGSSSRNVLGTDNVDETNNDSGGVNDAEGKAWRLVYDVALHSLDNLHAVIDLLGVPESDKSEMIIDGSSETKKETRVRDAQSSLTAEAAENETEANIGNNGMPTSFADEFGQVIERSEASLQQQGFSGRTKIKDFMSFPTKTVKNAEQYDELKSLIGEIYANIAYHADKSQPWKMSVTYRDGTITIKQSNAVASLSDQSTRKCIPLGRGLNLHEQTIQELGGSVETQMRDESWKLIVRLPIRN